MSNIKRLALTLMLAPAFLASEAEVTLDFAGEQSASVGIYIKDLSTEEVIAENDAYKAILPASVMKSITAAASITELGPDFRFATKVYLYGHQGANKTVWDGNLVIESCGDPTIDSNQFKTRKSLADEIAEALVQKGIKCINGSIVIEQPQLQQGCLPEWEIGDVAWAYGAGWYGFNFADNSFTLKPSTKVTSPPQPDLNIKLIKDSEGTDLVRGIGSENLYVYSSNPTNPKWVTESSMPDPAKAYAPLLAEKLRRAGIEVKDQKNQNVSSRTLVCTHESPALSEMLKETMHVSHNLFAEGMLRAQAPGETRKEAIKSEYATLKALGVDTSYNNIIDGSGLARANRIQPIFVSDVLESMAKSVNAQAYISTFPIAGKSGTVKRLLSKTPLEGQLALKSGSMNAVQCYAGYKLDADGMPTHTVVVMINAFYCERAKLRKSIEEFLLKTFTETNKEQ